MLPRKAKIINNNQTESLENDMRFWKKEKRKAEITPKAAETNMALSKYSPKRDKKIASETIL